MASTPIRNIVKLKAQTNQLKDEEFDAFLSRLWRKEGRKQIMHLLCAPLLKPSPTGDDVESLKDMLGITSQIIMMRDSPQNAPFDRNNPGITSLPSAIIGEIASYQTQRSYANLSICCRKFFIDCNPNTLELVDLRRVPVDAVIHTKCTRVKKMRIHIEHYIPPNLMECRSLKSIVLYGFSNATWGSMQPLQRLMDAQPLFFSTITELGLNSFSVAQSIPRFVELLERCSSVERLHLVLLHFGDDRLSAEQLNRACPNLNHLSLVGNVANVASRGQEIAVLRAWHSRVDTFMVFPAVSDSLDALPNIEWANLRKLGLHDASFATTNRFMDLASNLNQIYFVPHSRARRDSQMTDHQMEMFVRQFIVDLPKMKYLYVSTLRSLERICNAINYGLYCTKNTTRNQMEIGLVVDCSVITDATDFVWNINRVLSGLAASKIGEWILSVEASSTGAFEYRSNGLGAAINDMISTTGGQLLKRTRERFIIGNTIREQALHHHWWDDTPTKLGIQIM